MTTRLLLTLTALAALITAPSTYHPGDDTTGEQWWTTTECPAGVQVPCLDLTVDGAAGLPADVASQVRHLIDAQWVCIAQVGQPMPDGTVRVTDDQYQQCHQHAYAAL